MARSLAAIEGEIAAAGGTPGPRLVEMIRAVAAYDMPRLIALLEIPDADV